MKKLNSMSLLGLMAAAAGMSFSGYEHPMVPRRPVDNRSYTPPRRQSRRQKYRRPAYVGPIDPRHIHPRHLRPVA